MNTKIMFSSMNLEWRTPKKLFKRLEKEFGGFDLDPATDKDNPLGTPYYFTKKDNGLRQKWFGKVFLNPPYGKEIGKWIKKAYEETKVCKNADLVVCLIPSRTDTKWWHDYVMKADEIRFIRSRLKFEGANNSAPFPSAIIIFRRVVSE